MENILEGWALMLMVLCIKAVRMIEITKSFKYIFHNAFFSLVSLSLSYLLECYDINRKIKEFPCL